MLIGQQIDYNRPAQFTAIKIWSERVVKEHADIIRVKILNACRVSCDFRDYEDFSKWRFQGVEYF